MYKPGEIMYNIKALGLSTNEAVESMNKLFGYWGSKDTISTKSSDKKIYEEAEKELLKAEKYKKYLDSLNN